MTKYLCISNLGELARDALRLMGASTKRNDSRTIGMFGSGFKYALAYFLRNGIDVRIFSGKREIPIATATVDLRGKRFEEIVVDGVPTSLTTDLGPRWTAADAVREVWANALDEGGAHWVEGVVEPKGRHGRTSVFIEQAPKVQEVIDNRNHYFCADWEVVEETPFGQVLRPPIGVPPRVFVKGMWATDSTIPLAFAHNLFNAQVNEERKLAGLSYDFDFAQHLRSIRNEEVVKTLFLHEAPTVEWDALRFSSPPKEWKGLLKDWDGHLYIEAHLPYIRTAELQRGVKVHPSVFEILTKHLGLTPALNAQGARGWESVSPDERAEALFRVEQCRKALAKAGVDIRVPIKIHRSTSPEVLAEAKDNTIILSYQFVMQADFNSLASCLLEENLHITRGFRDCTREFQTYLLDELTRQLIGEGWSFSHLQLFKKEEK